MNFTRAIRSSRSRYLPRRLRDAGLRLAVVTSKRRFSVEMALDSFPDLREVFDVFVTMEDTTEHKPLPAPHLKGLELLGDVSPERAAYVGDAPFDVAAARAAGVMRSLKLGRITAKAWRRGPTPLRRPRLRVDSC